MNIQYDGDGHLVFFYGKERFICVKCDIWYMIKHWRKRE